MPLFQSSTPFDADVGVSVGYVILRLGSFKPKDALKAILKRMCHRVPHVSLQAVTLLAACVNNCGKPFHLEICSRDFINEARTVIQRAHSKVAEQFKENIEQWAKEFKDDPQLHLLPQFYRQLKSEGVSFSKSSPDTNKAVKGDIDFKEDLDLAIALSLQDAPQSSKATTSELYPTAGLGSSSTPFKAEQRKVRALYDFEAAEDNELSFKTGEIILVSDDSDQNWWKGENARGVGLFPANFVTSDLSAPPPEEPKKEKKKKVRFSDEEEKQRKEAKGQLPLCCSPVSPEKIETCLTMLKNASPTEEDDEEENIRDLEEACAEMSPLVHNKIDESEKKRTHLEDMNQKFIQAITLYQQCMKEPVPTPTPPAYASGQQHYHQPTVGSSNYAQSVYQPQMPPQMMLPAQMSPLNAQPGIQYQQRPVTTVASQPQSMEAIYASQGPPSIPVQQQYASHYQPQQQQQQPVGQSTGYTDSSSYAYAVSAQATSYAPSQQGAMTYDYQAQPQQQQQHHGQMYSQATVYQ
eukprot:gene12248-13510_t